MERDDRKRLWYKSLSIFLALAMSITFFFLLFRLKDISDSFSKIWGAIGPFVYGTAIAYVLNPVCNFFERIFCSFFEKARCKDPMKPAKPMSIVVTMVLALLCIYFLIASLLPQLLDSLMGLVNTMPDKLEQAQIWAEETLQGHEELLNSLDTSIDSIEDFVYKWFTSEFLPNINIIVGSFSSGVVSIFGFLKNAFISVIVAIYVLSVRKKVVRKIEILLSSILKDKYFHAVWEELNYADKMFSGFISGKIIDSAIIGVLTFIVLTIWNMISGFNYVLLISVVIGVTNLIPFFGPFIGAIPCAVLILLDSPMNCVGFVIFIVILQQIDGNILGPKILGNATGISSFGVLFAVLLFGSMWGFVGMLVGVPVYGIIYDVIMKLIMKGLRRNGKYEMADECLRERMEALESSEKEEQQKKNRFGKRKKEE